MSDSPIEPTNVSRRDFLRVGSLGVVSLSLAEQARALHPSPKPRRCVFIMMNGGASQLETFDPKPEAPREMRGPLRPISTNVPGIAISEAFPKIAQRMNRVSIIRSLHHEDAPIHETGMQWLQTGRLARGATRFPSFGSVIKQVFGNSSRGEVFAVHPSPIRETGVNAWRGQGAGFLGEDLEPLLTGSLPEGAAVSLSPLTEREAVSYGENQIGTRIAQARQLIEQGISVVTVNLFDTLQGEISFDAHAHAPHSPTTLQDYVEKLGPQFDQAYVALLDDLQDRGLLQETIVVACGEFGRSPRMNANGGRDHWTRCWSALVAGDGIPGGQVIGATDSTASEIIDRPVHPSELTASLYHLLGVPTQTLLRLPDGNEIPLIEAKPMPELIGSVV